MPSIETLKISIITIVRNGMPFVEQTLDSVIEQDYPHIEYIVIDGLSQDDTVKAIQAREGALSYWISEKDLGIADAFNKGLAQATGDYLLFLNADDALMHPQCVTYMVKAMMLNQCPDFIYGDCQLIDRASASPLYVFSKSIRFKDFLYGHIIPQPCTFTHQRYFKKYGGFDTEFKIAMDFEHMVRGLALSSLVHIPCITTRVRNGGISTHNQTQVINEIIKALKKNGHIRSFYGELELRGYFFCRKWGRLLLQQLRLYQWFDRWRHPH